MSSATSQDHADYEIVIEHGQKYYVDTHGERNRYFTPAKGKTWHEILTEAEQRKTEELNGYEFSLVVNMATRLAGYTERSVADDVNYEDFKHDVDLTYGLSAGFEFMSEAPMMLLAVVSYLGSRWQHGELLQRWYSQERTS